jgi:hypothetical protein
LEGQFDRSYGVGRIEKMWRTIDRLYGAGRLADTQRQIDQLYGAGRIAELQHQIDQLYGAGRIERMQRQIDQLYGAGRIEELQGQIARLLGYGQMREALAAGPLRDLDTEARSLDANGRGARIADQELSEFRASLGEAAAEIGEGNETSEPFAWVSRLSPANRVRLLGAAIGLLSAVLVLASTPDQTPSLTTALVIGVLPALIEALAICIDNDSN